jgi:hypothetical protein
MTNLPTKVTEFGKATKRVHVPLKDRGSWWADPQLQQDRTKFYDMAARVQPDMNPSMLPLKTGGEFN